jgi:hypothetical protein
VRQSIPFTPAGQEELFTLRVFICIYNESLLNSWCAWRYNTPNSTKLLLWLLLNRQSDHFSHLCSLELNSNELGTAALIALLAAPTISNLRAFACDFNEIGSEGLRNIESVDFKHLSCMSLMDNNLGDIGIAHLSKLRTGSGSGALDVSLLSLLPRASPSHLSSPAPQ